MDMLKPMRVSFSAEGEEEKDGGSNNRGRRIPHQKAQTSKETKRTVSWLERQFTRQTNRDHDSNNGVDYPTAVAVAAFVVKSIEDKSNRKQTKTSSGADKPLSKIQSKADERPQKSIDAKASKSSSRVQDKNVVIRTATVNKEPSTNPVPSLKKNATSADTKKNSTFADKNIDITTPKTPETMAPELALPPTRQSTSQLAMAKGPITAKPGTGNSKADIWEKEEMKKIKERYEKLKKVIHDWETKKKKKAKRHLEQTEAQLDKRRAKARDSFYSDIGRIEHIAGGAKSQAEKNQENEEFKVKEKANKIRSTGKMPPTCLCY
ncbi:PREDICTED: uncharacterized protein At3g61260-like [Nicotiana attenuata]|uniref:Remorin C-terminal domain-containing protein n=1 Tax=Nicotiana attenuata TaxID=49451 RepID=A0A1J6IPP6_NICAT|nr:PREDICTED: uncharacterized protein At3g61260-like [Nicotiana attenuata]OIT06682.1 hypothetical protein A4A49_08886 [Nicotiana attenuata]